jgi:flavodoxin
MKHLKTFLIAVMIVMAISFAACGTTNNSPDTGDNGGIVIGGDDETQTPSGGDSANGGNENQTPSDGDNTGSENESQNPSDGDTTTSSITIESDSNILVVYFSATNTTERVATYISEITDGALFEIEPAVSYTSADLNYNNSSSRSQIEQRDPNARPAIKNTIENIEQFDVVYVGYPIWNGYAPKVIYTFLEAHNFADKTIVPFCTAASSGIGSSATTLHGLVDDSVAWLSGTRFLSGATKASVETWIEGLDLPTVPAQPETPDSGNEDDEKQEIRILVAYFSATNTTEGIANYVAGMTGGDLYEITPAVPYTADDLKYYTDGRADQEQADPTARPAISGSVENMDDYDIIYIGYPIWHGQAPKIIYTFLESYDFSEKTIVTFCTSASSGIGSSSTNLHSLASDATWVDGQRFSGSASQTTIDNWVISLNLPYDSRKDN